MGQRPGKASFAFWSREGRRFWYETNVRQFIPEKKKI